MRRFHQNSQSARSEPLEPRLMLTGLTAQYFDRVDFTDLKVTRVDPNVAFNWGTAAPDPSMNADNFAVRWTGQVQPQSTEDYTFYVRSDDGARLWVDGRLIVDNWITQSATEKSATLPLVGGQNYDIRLDYFDGTSGAQVQLSWSSPSVAKQFIPAAYLFPSPTGLAATYFDNQDFSGAAVSRTDGSIDFNWGAGSPTAGISPTTFSAVWTGQIVPQFSQTYWFYVTPDVGATAQLRVDRELVFDSNSVQPSGQIQLEAGKLYDIELRYTHGTGSANIKLEWSSPSQGRQVIPTSQLMASQLGAIPTRRPTYTNAVLNLDRPDPGVIFSDGYYWMTHTTGGPNQGWPLYRSGDLTSWTSMGPMLNSMNKPAFMTGSFWAPEIHKIGGTYVITGTAKANSTYNNRLVIAIATASEITGPYTVRSTPIVADSVHVLDSTIFQDLDGRVYLIWKRDGPSNGEFGSIRMRELDRATLTSFAAGSTERNLLNNVGGGAWESNLEEGPWMVHHGDYYYLFYSGAHIDTTYAQGVARSTSLTGPYVRYTDNLPILTSNSTWGGPGHGSFIQDVDGTVWFYYHARHQDNPNFGRVQMLDKVTWTAEGWPTFTANSGTPSVTAQVGVRVNAVSGFGRYSIAGDAGGVAANDLIQVFRDAGDPTVLVVQVNGVTKLSVPFGEIENLTLTGGSGNDTIVLDYSHGEVIPGSGINFVASTGTDAVRVVGAGGDAFHLTAGRVTHGSGTITFSAAERFIVQGGTFSVDADLNGMQFDASGNDTTVLFATPLQHLGAVALNGAAAARFAAASGMGLSVASLTIVGGGRLDLADNVLVVDYTSTSALDAVRMLLLSGRAGGTWDGSGIVSSTAAATPRRGIGYAEASALGVSSWGGLSVDTTVVVLVSAQAGDTNIDGRVDFDDYARSDRGRAKGLGTWLAGDFDYDGSVTQADYDLINASFVTGPAAPGASLTPAPMLEGTLTVAPAVMASTPSGSKRADRRADVAVSVRPPRKTTHRSRSALPLRIVLTNSGNGQAVGPVDLRLVFSSDSILDEEDQTILTMPISLSLKAKDSKAMRLSGELSYSLIGNSGYVFAVVSPGTGIGDANAANDQSAPLKIHARAATRN